MILMPLPLWVLLIRDAGFAPCVHSFDYEYLLWLNLIWVGVPVVNFWEVFFHLFRIWYPVLVIGGLFWSKPTTHSLLSCGVSCILHSIKYNIRQLWWYLPLCGSFPLLLGMQAWGLPPVIPLVLWFEARLAGPRIKNLLWVSWREEYILPLFGKWDSVFQPVRRSWIWPRLHLRWI